MSAELLGIDLLQIDGARVSIRKPLEQADQHICTSKVGRELITVTVGLMRFTRFI